MPPVQHNRIKSRLLELVAPNIDVSDITGKPAAELQKHKLSRCIAAAAVRLSSDADAPTAAAAVVDGGADNGIDAIHFDAHSKILYLIQAKWSDTHSGSIDLAGVLKFIEGVKDLVSLKKNSFNRKIRSRWALIEDGLDKARHIRLLIAYPGSGQIDQAIRTRLDDLVASQNDTSDMFSWGSLSQREFFSYFAREAAPPQIDLDIHIAHYGVIESPLKAIYGQVSAVEVAKWHKAHGNHLFSGNIRHFLGFRSEVNEVVLKTLNEHAQLFWFYNNGITLIAQDVTRKAVGSADRSIGVFECRNVTVVNGAQTVGTIGRASIPEDSEAVVQVRVIKVEDPESSLGRNITRASNTQNRIDARNFVALDSEQERIRTELLLENVNYEFREGEPLESLVGGFEFIEAITVLACAQPQISYVAMAKGYVGGLYSDIEAAPYKTLFNPSTNSSQLWSLVKLSRRIDRALKATYPQPSGTTRGIIVHGNRFTLHCVLRRLARKSDLSKSDAISDKAVLTACKSVFRQTEEIINREYPEAYAAPLFKNVGKCTKIRELLEAAPPEAPRARVKLKKPERAGAA